MNSYKNYIKLIRNILMNFDKEFDHMIIIILLKIFDNYYMNRNDKIYCLDNLYRKYGLSRYELLKKKYKVTQNSKLIFRFNRYSKKSYIIKLLKCNPYVILEENEIYESIAKNILKVSNIKNYKKYIRDIYLDKFISNLDCKEDDFKVTILKKMCFILHALILLLMIIIVLII